MKARARKSTALSVKMSRYVTEIVKTVALTQPFDNCIVFTRMEGEDVGYEPVGLALVKRTNGAHHLEIVVRSSAPKDGNPEDWEMTGSPMLLPEWVEKFHNDE